MSQLEARSQASGRLPCKTIYKGIRTCTTRQASVESARLLPTSEASPLETGRYITIPYLAGVLDTWA